MIERKLKPCPFCGGKLETYNASISNSGSYVGFSIHMNCRKCGMQFFNELERPIGSKNITWDEVVDYLNQRYEGDESTNGKGL